MRHSRFVSATCTASLLLVGCGGSGTRSLSVPTAREVVAAMRAQPHLIATLTGSPNGVGRVVVDAKARYQAIFAPAGRLLDLDKAGIEYRRIGRCFRRFRVHSMIAPAQWAVPLTEPGHPHYTTTVSGENVLFKSSGEQVTVDATTHLMRSDISPANRKEGVPYQSATFSYPNSVAELKTPSVCR